MLLFGVGAEAFGGGGAGVIASAIIALAVNYVSRGQQRRRFLRERQEAGSRSEPEQH